MLGAILGFITNIFKKVKYLYAVADAALTQVANDSIIAHILAKNGTVANFDDTTDSLEAIRDHATTIKTDTGKIPKSDGSVVWNATAQGILQTKAAAALNAYDPPTRSELTTDKNSIITNTDDLITRTKGLDDIHDDVVAIPTDAPSPNLTFEALADENIAEGDIVVETENGFVPLDALDTAIAGQLETYQLSGAPFSLGCEVHHIEGGIYVLIDGDTNLKFTAIRINLDGTVSEGDITTVAVGAVSIAFGGDYLNNYRGCFSYKNASNTRGYTIIYEVDPISLDISVGSSAEHSEGENSLVNGSTRSRNDVLIVCYNRDTTVDGRIRVGSVNTSSLAITFDAAINNGLAGKFTIGVSIHGCNIIDDKACFVCGDKGAGDDVYVFIVTVSGTTPTAGAEYELIDATFATKVIIRKVSETQIVVSYNSELIIAATFSGSTFASKGTTQALDMDPPNGIDVFINPLGAFVVAGGETTGDQSVIIFSLSGNNFTELKTSLLTGDFDDAPINARIFVGDGAGFGMFIRENASVAHATLIQIAMTDTGAMLRQIAGVADTAISAAATGTVIVNGIKEGGASGLDSRASYYFDGSNNTIIKALKGFGRITPRYVWEERIRVMNTDTQYIIG